MRALKYVLVFSIPILLFINLWRIAIGGNDVSYSGLNSTIRYVSDYPGFMYTYDTLMSIKQYFINPDPNVLEVLFAIFRIMWAPVEILIAVLRDVLNNVVFFFGWIQNVLSL